MNASCEKYTIDQPELVAVITSSCFYVVVGILGIWTLFYASIFTWQKLFERKNLLHFSVIVFCSISMFCKLDDGNEVLNKG